MYRFKKVYTKNIRLGSYSDLRDFIWKLFRFKKVQMRKLFRFKRVQIRVFFISKRVQIGIMFRYNRIQIEIFSNLTDSCSDLEVIQT